MMLQNVIILFDGICWFHQDLLLFLKDFGLVFLFSSVFAYFSPVSSANLLNQTIFSASISVTSALLSLLLESSSFSASFSV